MLYRSANTHFHICVFIPLAFIVSQSLLNKVTKCCGMIYAFRPGPYANILVNPAIFITKE